MCSIQECINLLNNHDMIEEADKLKNIANFCQCIECKQCKKEQEHDHD